MSRASTYLNFPRSTEQAFMFYRAVFGGDFNGPIHRPGEVPVAPDHDSCAAPAGHEQRIEPRIARPARKEK
jgi:PhnB protein